MTRHAGLLRQHRDFGKRLRDHAEEHVVANFDDACELAFAYIARGRPDELQQRRHFVEHCARAGTDE